MKFSVRDIVDFMNAAEKAVPEGTVTEQSVEFVCPLCGGKAYAGRADINDHLNGMCTGCDMRFIE